MQLNNFSFVVLSIILLVTRVSATKRQSGPDQDKVIEDLEDISRQTIQLGYDLASFLAEPCTGAAPFTDDFAYVIRFLNMVPVDVVAGEPWDASSSATVASEAQTYARFGSDLLDTLIANVTVMADWQKAIVLEYLQGGDTATLNMFTALISGLGESYFAGFSAAIAQFEALWLHAISVYS